MKRAAMPLLVAALLAASADARTESAEPTSAPLDRRPADPASVRAFDALRGKVAQLDAHKRGRLAAVSPHLRELPMSRLLPLLELASLDPDADVELDPSARVALRVGLLEAASEHRDPRARASYERLLRHGDPRVVRAAAMALGRLADDAAVAKLLSLVADSGSTRLAVVSALGSCRRLAVARALALSLAVRPEEDETIAVVRALGDVGSAWAWRTPSVAEHRDEEDAVRSAAARALLDAFLVLPAHLRVAASNALMMVDHPSTPAFIAEAKARHPTLEADLDGLARRFARNPAR